MKIAIILGTRPEIIKISAVIRELERRQENYFILHTGQHYFYNLDRVFFEQLKSPQAKHDSPLISTEPLAKSLPLAPATRKLYIKSHNTLSLP